ncbi:substrate-binding domain-containing protein [Lysobacter sp. HA35]
MGRRRRALTLIAMLLAVPAVQARELRVCADPNNLPFSKSDGSGFENKIIALIAKDLGAEVRYTWWAQRRGNVRSTINANECDVVPGVASGVDMLSTTQPYYRSTYVFVAKQGSSWTNVSSLDDPRLRDATIGVQLIGDDGANTPPAHALARRGLHEHIRGYTVYGDYADSTPQKPILDAVASGEIDLALVWGPTAGYYAKQAAAPLLLTPVTPWLDGAEPMVFDISMGVRRDDRALRRELDSALELEAPAIAKILDDYGIPRPSVDPAAAEMPDAAQK